MNAQNPKNRSTHRFTHPNSPRFARIRVFWLAWLMVIGLSAAACDGGSVVGPGQKNGEESESDRRPGNPDPGTPTDPEEENGQNPPALPDAEEDDEPWEDRDHEGHEGRGEAPGALSGRWRVATVEGDEPGVYFDIAHIRGAQSATGTYTMGFAIYAYTDGESGELIDAAYDGDSVQLVWNPTDDTQEILTLRATKQSNGSYEGAITARRNPDLDVQVTMVAMD